MRNTMRRLTSLLCVLALCLSLLPASALAADENAEPAPEDVVEDTLPTEPEPEESAEPEESTEPEPEEEVATFAEEDVAKIGDKTYATLDEAIMYMRKPKIPAKPPPIAPPIIAPRKPYMLGRLMP